MIVIVIIGILAAIATGRATNAYVARARLSEAHAMLG